MICLSGIVTFYSAKNNENDEQQTIFLRPIAPFKILQKDVYESKIPFRLKSEKLIIREKQTIHIPGCRNVPSGVQQGNRRAFIF